MKQFLIILLFLGGILGPPSHLEMAKENYAQKKYAESIAEFEAALEQYPLKAQAIRYNIGQNQMAMDSLPLAMESYFRAFDDVEKELTSMSHNNQGVVQTRMAKAMQEGLQKQMQAQQGQQQQPGGPNAGGMQPSQMQDVQKVSSELLKTALESFKEAMRKFPDNEQARFNYELLKRRLDQNQQQQQQQQNQDQQNQQQDQQNQDKQDNQDQNQSQDQNKQDQDSDQEQQSQKQNQSSSKNKQNNRQPQEGKGEKAEYSEIPDGMEEQVLKAMEGKEKQFLQELRKSAKKQENRTDGPDW
ncbi:MAG: hypothetical protein H6581_00305 [Bacteroidia bacterium]|nr:hypothetical protein [Bacteroidia bacterium]